MDCGRELDGPGVDEVAVELLLELKVVEVEAVRGPSVDLAPGVDDDDDPGFRAASEVEPG